MEKIKNKCKWALVTGASSGIGKAFAEKLAPEYNLILTARRIELLEEIKKILSVYSNEIVLIKADLSDVSEIENFITNVEDYNIDLLICNAGFAKTGKNNELKAQDTIDMINLNCTAVLRLISAISEKMIKGGNGEIIIISSVLGLIPSPYSSVYGATKSFVFQLGQSLFHELARFNVKILTVCPGGTSTEFQRVSKMNTGLFVRKPEQVVETALTNIGRKSYVVDGLLNKIMVSVTKLIPQKILNLFTGAIIGRMNGIK